MMSLFALVKSYHMTTQVHNFIFKVSLRDSLKHTVSYVDIVKTQLNLTCQNTKERRIQLIN